MIYNRQARTVPCYPKNNRPRRAGWTTRPALDWLAALVTHIPDRGQQLVRFYRRYSNVCQARKKRTAAGPLQRADRRADEKDDAFGRQSRRNWPRLLKKIYEVDPLVCVKCQTPMKIISFIQLPPVIKKILAHLNLWDIPQRSPPDAVPPRDFV